MISKNFVSIICLVIVVLIVGWFVKILFDKEPNSIITMGSNISMSNEEDNPPVNNTVTTVELKFSEALDPSTVTDAVKLYRMNGNGIFVEEPCLASVDSDNPTSMKINNSKIEKFTEGEAYKLVVTSQVKSVTGLSLDGGGFTGYFTTNYTQDFTNIEALNNTRSQIVVISDVHLGIDDSFTETKENRAALVDFLGEVKNSPNVKELVIAGDLLDGWFLPMDYQLPDSQETFFDAIALNNKSVIDALNAIIKEGKIKVTYVPGNHDLLLTQADIDRIFPGMKQARDNVQGLGLYVTGDNSQIVIEHGHRYNFFCAPDQFSNREITNNTTSILPPGYFFTRMATSSVVEGHPASRNSVPDVTVNKNDPSQYEVFLYFKTWQQIILDLPVSEQLTDKIIKTNIDGYTEDYALTDIIPYQNPTDGKLDMTLYKGIQDTWEERQELNGVKTLISTEDAITKVADSGFTDIQAKNQFFDVDASKRIVVFGHTHVARLLTFSNLEGNKAIYANSGTWIDHEPGNPTMTFVVITPTKEDSAVQLVNLYQYDSSKTITQWKQGQAIVE